MLINFAKLNCIFQSHSYSKQGEKAADKQRCTIDLCCYYEKCTRCGKVSDILIANKHKFGDAAATADEACTFIRTCEICGFTQKTIHHDDFQWVMIEGSCEYIRVCKNCGFKDNQTRIEHSFSEWSLQRNTCLSNRTCTRCGLFEEKVEHSGEWVTVESTTTRSDGTEKWICQQRVCKLCGTTEFREYQKESPWA